MSEQTYAEDLEPGDDVNSLDEANQAAIQQCMALRVQPAAPKPTEYYFHENGKWKRQKCGHSVAATMDVSGVRKRVKRAINSGHIRVVEMDRVEKYA